MEVSVPGQAEFQLISFKLAEEGFAIDIRYVKEIIRYHRIIPIPGGPEFLEGVISLRGIVVPVMDLRRRFGLKSSVDKSTRVIITVIGAHVLALVVDDVSDIVTSRKEEIVRPRKGRKSRTNKQMLGVLQTPAGPLKVINLPGLLTREELDFLETPIARTGFRKKRARKAN